MSTLGTSVISVGTGTLDQPEPTFQPFLRQYRVMWLQNHPNRQLSFNNIAISSSLWISLPKQSLKLTSIKNQGNPLKSSVLDVDYEAIWHLWNYF